MDYVPGVLLTGPPGCGKRSLIRRVAVECDAMIVHVDSSLHGARPGDSERNLQAAFRRAADVSTDDLCILYLDELDAICPRRRDTGTDGDSLATRLLAELLNLMDKLHENPGRFVVVATTSKPTDVDPCLRRFGRFEKEVSGPF
jgi:SpoVK/Ycf46/Vps4 family AAA+-type ATPase